MTISVKSILLLCIVVIISRCSASSSNFAGLPAGNKGSFLFKIPRGGAVTECKTLGELDQIISDAALTDKLVIIDFTATWCGPCKMIAPIYAEMSEKYDNVIFVKVDVDENAEAAMKYSVSAMPTFLFIKKGEDVERVVGANVALLEELVQSLA